uniref:Uncharacterized protein n=1 Tax=Romanomermis culicivorax TaxID=13658 RepID=A0A915I412_ROMCU
MTRFSYSRAIKLIIVTTREELIGDNRQWTQKSKRMANLQGKFNAKSILEKASSIFTLIKSVIGRLFCNRVLESYLFLTNILVYCKLNLLCNNKKRLITFHQTPGRSLSKI